MVPGYACTQMGVRAAGCYPAVVFSGGGDVVDCRLLGLAHLLAVLAVGSCDLVGQGDDEAPVLLDLHGRRLALQQSDRVA